jgi:DNA-binding NtrC family response regulator
MEPGGAAARVLVVDNEIALAVALKKVLDEDHDVTAVTTAEQALNLLLDGSPFDAIVCDVLMPGTSGIDLFKQLKERRPNVARRIIFMTGASSMERVAEFFRTVDNVCIDKPVDVPRLRRLIREMAAT